MAGLTKGWLLGAGALAALLAAPALAASSGTADTGTTLEMQVTASVKGTPDLATIEAGVVTEGRDAATALSDNSGRMARVVAALKREGVAAADIQTARVALQPRYHYTPEKAAELTGFQATNSVRVTLRDVARAGAVLDALAAEGANQISGPDFSFADPEPLADKARADAVRTARARADVYAKAAGLKVGRIVSMRETSAPARPMPRVMAMAADAAQPPIEAGESSVTVALSVTWELEAR